MHNNNTATLIPTTTTTTTDAALASAGLIGSFSDLDHAELAIADLGKHGIPAGAISLVSHCVASEAAVQGFVSATDIAGTGATGGAWIGGVLGILAGAAIVFTPVGPVVVAGGLAATLLGGVEGAGVGAGLGAVTGAIFGHFVGKRHIPMLETHLTAGKYLVVVNGEDDVLATANDVLVTAGANVSVHTNDTREG